MEKSVAFRHVDLFACMERILNKNTAFYRSDFEIDKEMLKEALKNTDKEDRVLLWISRPCGTNCYYEKKVFLKDSNSQVAWLFYQEQVSDRTLAYAVEVTGEDEEEGTVIGNLYPIDYAEHCKRVKEKSVDAEWLRLIYEKGERYEKRGKCLVFEDDPEYGRFVRFEFSPSDPEKVAKLRETLSDERRMREKMRDGVFAKHLENLHRELIRWEADRIEKEFRKVAESDVSKKKKLSVSVSVPFVRIVGENDVKKMVSLLPYRSAIVSKIEGWTQYVTVDRNEILESAYAS